MSGYPPPAPRIVGICDHCGGEVTDFDDEVGCDTDGCPNNIDPDWRPAALEVNPQRRPRTGEMGYRHHHGRNCDRNRDITEDAQLIRAEIAKAKAAGDLPADWRYSVRIDRYSMGQSINLRAISPRPIVASTDWEVPITRRYTPEAAAVSALLDDLHDSFNYDGSDVLTDYFDVKFYGTVVIDVAEGVERSVAA